MLRPFVVLASILSIVAAMSGIALAQSEGGPPPRDRGHRNAPPRGFGGFFQGMDLGMLAMLQREPVQKELGLTEEQVAKIKEVFKEVFAARQRMGELKDLSPEERDAKVKELRKEAMEKAKAAQKKLPEILKPAQWERLKQIFVQRENVFALRNAEITKALGLTEEQNGKIRKILDQTHEEAAKVFDSLRNLSPEEMREKRAEFQEKTRKIREEAAKKIKEVLTPEQREELEKMKGKPFKDDRPQRPRRQPDSSDQPRRERAD
jgi:Spy/CpxP family protein refolding chaperone